MFYVKSKSGVVHATATLSWSNPGKDYSATATVFCNRTFDGEAYHYYGSQRFGPVTCKRCRKRVEQLVERISAMLKGGE